MYRKCFTLGNIKSSQLLIVLQNPVWNVELVFGQVPFEAPAFILCVARYVPGVICMGKDLSSVLGTSSL